MTFRSNNVAHFESQYCISDSLSCLIHEEWYVINLHGNEIFIILHKDLIGFYFFARFLKHLGRYFFAMTMHVGAHSFHICLPFVKPQH
jgi:hypothetical protein